jgi:hypothetical protein
MFPNSFRRDAAGRALGFVKLGRERVSAGFRRGAQGGIVALTLPIPLALERGICRLSPTYLVAKCECRSARCGRLC